MTSGSPILCFYTSFLPDMRIAILLMLILPGCVHPSDTSTGPARERTARLLAALIETAAKNRQAGLDSARAEAAADSVLRSESVTRQEFLSDVRSLNRDVAQWREVSEAAARILEQHLAARGAGR
jgi:thiamine biosynthesis lipoprotein ApbE